MTIHKENVGHPLSPSSHRQIESCMMKVSEEKISNAVSEHQTTGVEY